MTENGTPNPGPMSEEEAELWEVVGALSKTIIRLESDIEDLKRRTLGHRDKREEGVVVQDFIAHLSDNPGINKTAIYALPYFSRNKRDRVLQYERRIFMAKAILQEKGMALRITTGTDSRSVTHYIIENAEESLD